MTTPRKSHAGKRPAKKWSARVTRTSHAMDLKKGVFTSDDPKRIARSVLRSARRSSRLKAGAYRSAVSMISFYENRGGRNLPASKKRVLQRAKKELAKQTGRAAG